MNAFIYYVRLFWQLFKRDCYVFTKRWKPFAINYILFCPVVYATTFGYIIPYSGMEECSVHAASVFFAGSVLWLLYPLAFMLCLEVFFDLQQNRFIDYQLTLAPARLVVFERLIFFSLVVWVHLIPYYPLSSWLLGEYLDTSAVSWPMLFILLYFCALFFVAFNLFFVFFVESMHRIGDFFTRVVFPMVQLGGVRTPLSVMFDFAYLLGALSLLNPAMYMTEGIRQALFHSPEYLSYTVVIMGLLTGTVLSFIASLICFKKRVDHI